MSDKPAETSKRVLIIDDEEMILDILQRRFERMGFQVITAGDGEQGMQALQNGIFDLVICDLQMPHGTRGADILQASRSRLPDSKFVFMSGQLLPEDHVEKILENGADLFVKKPFSSLSETTGRIAELLK